MIDATTGQNGLAQARQFTDATEVTGVVLTKLDGSAKGGIVFAIQTAMGIPVKLVGLGETSATWWPSIPTSSSTPSLRNREPGHARIVQPDMKVLGLAVAVLVLGACGSKAASGDATAPITAAPAPATAPLPAPPVDAKLPGLDTPAPAWYFPNPAAVSGVAGADQARQDALAQALGGPVVVADDAVQSWTYASGPAPGPATASDPMPPERRPNACGRRPGSTWRRPTSRSGPTGGR